MNVLSCGPKASNISKISDAISPRYIRKNPRSMHVRVPHIMAQFVLKIELLSHIMVTAPILEIARAYGLHPRLWLLVLLIQGEVFPKGCYVVEPLSHELRSTVSLSEFKRKRRHYSCK